MWVSPFKISNNQQIKNKQIEEEMYWEKKGLMQKVSF